MQDDVGGVEGGIDGERFAGVDFNFLRAVKVTVSLAFSVALVKSMVPPTSTPESFR
jgi:hypothetical protein